VKRNSTKDPSVPTVSGQHGDVNSSASGVHFQVRIFTEFFDFNEPSFSQPDAFQLLALFGATISSTLPDRSKQGLHFVSRRAGP
jgi:hypothetical protein